MALSELEEGEVNIQLNGRQLFAIAGIIMFFVFMGQVVR